jgi:hypothetical protein
MLWQMIFEWTAVVLLLGLGLYTVRVIRNEKINYIKEAREIHFHIFKFFVPKWWSSIETGSENEICFKRLDTHYNWEARFHWLASSTETDLIKIFKNKIHDRKILFDEEETIIYDPTDCLSGAFELVRLEGTATENQQERLYYDAFILREKKSGKFLYAESKSSVLNGLVEGPYFEEVMKRIELI